MMDDQDQQGFKPSTRRRGPKPTELHPDLKGPREALTRLLDSHVVAARQCLGFPTGDIYLPDLLFAGFVQRSFHLVEGFLSEFDAGNVIVAAPLVRLQIDNLLRITYLSTGVDLDETALYLLGGGEFRKLKDKEGKALTDKRLCELAAGRHPWVEAVYRGSSGWVHFSGSHIRTVYKAGNQPGTFEGGFPLRPDFVPEHLFLELLEAMAQATSDLLVYFASWGEHKKTLAAGAWVEER